MHEAIRVFFWARVKRRGPDDCWEWLGAKSKKGYGKFVKFNKRWLAHRVSYEIANGPFPYELCVCHECDNPPCVNPRHLWLGTKGRNNADRVAKGRSARGLKSGRYTKPHRTARGDRNGMRTHPRIGELNSRAKLSAEQVREIRQLYGSGGLTQVALGRMYGVTDVMISCIVRHRNWTHV